jgi:FMN phosphatase YigB (HAD superfamily)
MDNALENIESAKKLGMETIWWNKEELKENLLNETRKLLV